MKNFDEGKLRVEKKVEAPFSHGPDFLKEAKIYLQKQKIDPAWSETYHLLPGTEAYTKFLHFFVSELEDLPFNNKVGKTIEMRLDAKEVITRLVKYLKQKIEQVSKSGKWSTEDLEQIADIFKNMGLEVFKNEIYPGHKIDGIGYNVDLSAVRSGEKIVPSEIILERRYVKTKKDFEVIDSGFLRLNLSRDGGLELDLSEFPTQNVHAGKE